MGGVALMAVAGFKREGQSVVQRSFDPPKRASLRAWYNAATKGVEQAPRFTPELERRADVTVDTIIFHGAGWTLYIARKRNLR